MILSIPPRPVPPSPGPFPGPGPDPDVALVSFPLNKRAVSVLPLAPAWQRPKAFPTAAVSVGAGGVPRADV